MKYMRNIAMLFVAMMTAFTVSSCTDDDTDSGSADRLFRPVNIIVSAKGTTVSASWAGMDGASGYTAELYVRSVVEVSGEGEEAEVEKYEDKVLVARDENVQGTSWEVPGLEYNTQYYFRVKTNNVDPARNSYFSDFTSIKTPMETQVLKYTIDDARNGIVTFTWMSGYDLTYIEVTNPDGEVKTYSIDDTAGSMTLAGLSAGTYSAVAGNNSASYNVVSFLIPVLYEVEEADITFEGVTLRWAADGNISTLRLVNTATQDKLEYKADINGAQTISAEELGYRQTYLATLIYSDDTTTNSVQFTTMDQKPEGTLFVSTYEELKAAITDAADGATIALNPGTYEVLEPDDTGALVYSTIILTKGVTLRAATASMPTIRFKQFELRNTTELELVRIDGLEFVGYDEEDSASSSSYLFDLTTSASASVKNVEIENCKIHGIGNSLVRADRSATISVLNILINNNMMWNMNGKQAYVSTYNSDTGVATESLVFTNNTITGLSAKNANQRAFAYLANANHVLNISNNTFYNCQNGTNPLIHARGTKDGSWGKVTVKSNIFYAQMKDEKTPNSKPNFGDGSSPTIDGNVMPIPWGSYNSTTGVLTTYDWSEYSTITADPEFADPDNLDFTVTNDTVLKAGAGDPRWLTAE